MGGAIGGTLGEWTDGVAGGTIALPLAASGTWNGERQTAHGTVCPSR